MHLEAKTAGISNLKGSIISSHIQLLSVVFILQKEVKMDRNAPSFPPENSSKPALKKYIYIYSISKAALYIRGQEKAQKKKGIFR